MVKLMGCFLGKSAAVDDSRESPMGREFGKGSSDIRVNRVNSSRRGESFRAKGRDKKAVLANQKLSGSRKVRDVIDSKSKADDFDEVVYSHPAIGIVPRAVEGAQVAAGWPSWLASVAAEAINGWVPRRTDSFQKIEKIGQGTYSSVYKARDLTHNKIVALKRVRFDNMDPESVKFMAREILVLRRLDHPNVIKLEGLIMASCSLYLIFEYMEHDLTGLASLPESKFSEPQVKCYMKQLLSGLDHCHSRRVLHRDIKGSNLLINNNGILKIADFGLATMFDPNQNQPLTSRVVTLWYRPPELLLGATYYGDSVDLWSSGCILGELYARKPIMPGRTEVEQLHKIFKLCGSPSEEYWAKSKLPHSTEFKPLQSYRRRISESFKKFPLVAVGLMETLLAIDPDHRGTAADALNSEFFTTKPLPCNPSSLPKYTPSKEMDAKLRDEVSRRQRMGGDRGPQIDKETGRKPSWALPASKVNAESVAAMQRRQGNLDSKSRVELFSPNQLEATPGLHIDAHRLSHRAKELNTDLTDNNPQRISHSGPLVPGSGWARSEKRFNDNPIAPTIANLSSSSRLVAARMSENHQDLCVGPSESFRVAGPVGRSDRMYIEQSMAGSHLMGKGRPASKEPVLDNKMKNKIHFSGPLLVPNKNMDQMLKEHDRRIEEAARRAWVERARLNSRK